jgi:hypothetical protein
MKINTGILVVILSVVALSSCNNTRTYADMKRDQAKATKKLIAEKGFEIIQTYPSNGVFAENQFVELENGIYLNVVDSGNGTRALIGKTEVLTRFRVLDYADRDEPLVTDFFTNDAYPLEFLYGNASYVVSLYAGYYSGPYYNYFGTGIENILQYVGEGAVVKAIIPFEVGSTYQTTLGTPLYFEKLTFAFY